MNKNSENRFGVVPTVNIPRSVFSMKKRVRTTFNAGELVPIYINSDIMPGDTFTFDFTAVIRQMTPLTPSMDNAVADVWAFCQRNFNLWEHWKEFWGENPYGMWTDNFVEYSIPQLVFEASGANVYSIQKGDIADHFGLPLFTPTSSNKISVSSLPFRMNIQVWNNFFRNQNLQAPIDEYKGDGDMTVVADANRTTYDWLNQPSSNQVILPQCAPLNKLADYLTTCAIQPQKGDPVTLPLGSTAPVAVYGNGNALGFVGSNGNTGDGYEGYLAYYPNNGGFRSAGSLTVPERGTGNADELVQPYNDTFVGVNTNSTKSGLVGVADLTNAVASTVNALRLSFATQRILERSIYGTRYFETIKNFFHVTSPYAVQLVPEYLGGFRFGIDQTQVAQTSSSDAVSPQGNTAAYSLTSANRRLFTKSFTEHCTLIIYIGVRNLNSYDQGVERMWSRKRRLDFFHPQLAFLGYMGVKNKEIYADGSSNDDEIFGYQRHWAELMSEKNINSGEFHTTYNLTLDYWHYGDHYSTLPTLSGEWSKSTKENIARTLAVQNQDQYLIDSLFNIRAVRPLDANATPGLLDHY